MTGIIGQKIGEKTGIPDIVQRLSAQLSSSELSSLLLEVYEQRAARLQPGALLQQYRNNPFVQPADTDMIASLEKELAVLRFLQARQYLPVELSPVAQFGSCSAVGTVSQKKIISAIRHTEVLADATNALALHIAQLKQSGAAPAGEKLRFCTIHRHVRAARMPVKGYTPHFKIACMVAAGRDTGSFAFELNSLQEQLQHIYGLLTDIFHINDIYIKIQPRAGYSQGAALIAAQLERLSASLPCEVKPDTASKENNYYKGLQFKVIIPVNGAELEIADGGFVDWTQQLLGNHKERCLISGIGFSLLLKFFPG